MPVSEVGEVRDLHPSADSDNVAVDSVCCAGAEVGEAADIAARDRGMRRPGDRGDGSLASRAHVYGVHEANNGARSVCPIVGTNNKLVSDAE